MPLDGRYLLTVVLDFCFAQHISTSQKQSIEVLMFRYWYLWFIRIRTWYISIYDQGRIRAAQSQELNKEIKDMLLVTFRMKIGSNDPFHVHGTET